MTDQKTTQNLDLDALLEQRKAVSKTARAGTFTLNDVIAKIGDLLSDPEFSDRIDGLAIMAELLPGHSTLRANILHLRTHVTNAQQVATTDLAALAKAANA